MSNIVFASEKADLVIMGFSFKKLKKEKGEFFRKFGNVKDILFINAGQKIIITPDTEVEMMSD